MEVLYSRRNLTNILTFYRKSYKYFDFYRKSYKSLLVGNTLWRGGDFCSDSYQGCSRNICNPSAKLMTLPFKSKASCIFTIFCSVPYWHSRGGDSKTSREGWKPGKQPGRRAWPGTRRGRQDAPWGEVLVSQMLRKMRNYLALTAPMSFVLFSKAAGWPRAGGSTAMPRTSRCCFVCNSKLAFSKTPFLGPYWEGRQAAVVTPLVAVLCPPLRGSKRQLCVAMLPWRRLGIIIIY